MSRAKEILEGAFQKLAGKIEDEGKSKGEADAIAASAGRKKFGKKAYDKKISAGEKNEATKSDTGGKADDGIDDEEPDTSDEE
jgi:hypothetical protein